ncbi:MAG TPA: heavy metal-binding domain-containing protein [Blastocatellia bacterium]|nr:heavy metal-binding domain-containing protein [Blastocatellia bacterium]
MLRLILFATLSFGLAQASLLPVASAVQESKVYVCPMHPEVQSSTEGKCPKCEMKLVLETPAKKEPEADAEAYACPMHLEIRTGAPGKCPKCQMALVPSNPSIVDEFNLKVEVTPKAPQPNEKVRLRFVAYHPKTGQQVKQFALMHERLFHLFIISQDMTRFQHIHPEAHPDGSFTIETVLPAPGHYKIYSDIYPIEGTPQVLQHDLVTAGYKSDLMASEAKLTPDASLTKIVEGVKVTKEDAPRLGVDLSALTPGPVNPMKVELTLEPAEIIAGKPVQLKYRLTDAKTGEPIRDLVPYLAAWGHTLILSEDQTDYVHSHPEQAVPENAIQEKLRGGPDVTFDALLPRPGIYRIWTQFLRGDTLTTVSFTVKAVRLG